MMNFSSARVALILVAYLLAFTPKAEAGSGGQSGMYSLEGDADREITRREMAIVQGEDALRRGDAALQAGDIEQAYLAYKDAVDLIPDGPASRSLRARALARYSSTAVRYAEFLVSEGRYAQAESVAREVLQPAYNPDYRPAAVFLSRLEQPDYFNKTITPEFAEDRQQVEKLLLEANGFFDSGRYDLAQKRYDQVLAVDKYNTAAFRGKEQVEVAKQRYYDSAYNETRSRMLWQVDKAWERPKRKFVEARVTDSAAAEERKGTELMVARLNRIIIPRVDFRDATIRQAVNFLQQRSRDLDTTEIDPERRGVNIVLKLPSTPAPMPAALEVEGETPAPATFSPDARITLNLSNVPLYEALRYVATLAGLKVKVEPFAVSIVPLSEPTDTLEQREFKVPPGFIASGTGTEADGQAVAGRQLETGGAARLSARQSAKDFLESQGVEFPPGASANFNAGSSRLVVRNTPANLDLIESLVDAAMGAQPTQVEIEAKFVEISQNNLQELGFDWALGPFSIGDSGLASSGGTIISQSQNWPFINPVTSQPVGQDTITSGLRSGSGAGPDSAITINSLNALLAQNAGLPAAGGAAPAFLGLSGIFTNVQFQAVIRALNQKKGVDLMAAPKVTTKSGQKATINIAREFPYPQDFSPPQVPQSTGGGQNNVGGVTLEQDPIVTPSFPENFTTRKLGVSLEVEPQIGPDGYTIDLSLSPEVVDFDGFVNYGSPILAPQRNLTAGALGAVLNPLEILNANQFFTPTILTENVINQPIFSVRKVTTSVSIWDGQTVALGGLIREDVQKVNDKVPLLGDIPYAGVLFRSEVDQKIKQNLIVFVTARLMDAAGMPLRPEDDIDQEEIVEPLGLPEDLRKPSINAKGFRMK
jgi:general secretion pathway protein D